MHPIRKAVSAPEIPDKLYFRIGDVARLLEVPAYVLRFWETEFPQLKPNKGGTGQRLYRKKDVETALRIKSLLYDQGFTIPGARQVFKQEARVKEAAAAPFPMPVDAEASHATAAPVTGIGDGARDKQLRALQSEMRSLLSLLARPVSDAHPSTTNKVKAMRPRLVLEPKPEKPKGTFLPLRQPGLFGFDDGSDTDPGPMAS